MRQCANCGSENRVEARFCRQCGARLEALPPAPAPDETVKDWIPGQPIASPGGTVLEQPGAAPSPVDPHAPTVIARPIRLADLHAPVPSQAGETVIEAPGPAQEEAEDTVSEMAAVGETVIEDTVPEMAAVEDTVSEMAAAVEDTVTEMPAAGETVVEAAAPSPVDPYAPTVVARPIRKEDLLAAGEPALPTTETEAPPAVAETQVFQPTETQALPAVETAMLEAVQGEIPAEGGPVEKAPPTPETGQLDDADLLIGTRLAGRFQVLARLAEPGDGSQRYEAEDLARCWSCKTDQGEAGLSFCENCGAALSHFPHLILRRLLPGAAPQAGFETFMEGEAAYILEPADLLSPPTVLLPPRLARLASGQASDAGQSRSINEDSLLALQLVTQGELQAAPLMGFYAVADGVGGNEAGEVASRTAVRSFSASLLVDVFLPALEGSPLPAAKLAEALEEAVCEANQAILDRRASSSGRGDMGSTLTALLVQGSQAVAANVGDSRTYLLRDGKLAQVTRDHSVVARLVEQGAITALQASTHIQKNVIYRSLGDRPDLTVETFPLDLLPGDRLMLCSDGIWEMLPDAEIESTLLAYPEAQTAAERLVSLANQAGGDDNLTAIVVDVR
jgi:serine/threonine protein phosphatase PrpC